MDNFQINSSVNLNEPQPGCPESEYLTRLRERKEQLSRVRVLHARLWAYFIAATALGVALIYCAFIAHLVSVLWIVLPAMSLLASIRALARNAETHGRVQRIVGFYESGLARLRSQWQGQGISGEEFRPQDHLYAADLDLFGAGSLFELLCTARSRAGRKTLASWLLTPAVIEEARERQVAVSELRNAVVLREDWAALDCESINEIPATLGEWIDAPAITFPLYARIFAIVIPACLITAMICRVFVPWHYWPWVIAVLIVFEVVLGVLLWKKSKQATAHVTLPLFELELICPMLRYMESACVCSSLLTALQSQLTGFSSRPSKEIRKLRLATWLLDLRANEYFAILSAAVMGGTNLAIFVESWRQNNREGIARWLDALGRFEALLCLARYHYENPDHVVPALTPAPSALFDAENLGHPLLDRRTCVSCDLRLDGQGTQLLMVSGSNMAGKSTLLRSVGLNVVLALAGGPVRASRLHISHLQLGCSIAVADSLLHSKSRFQAEVERLRSILALSRERTTLFLLDEMLGGTNSEDRSFGAHAVIKKLLAASAIGIATTHDLALAREISRSHRKVTNAHFREFYENGKMCFDYRMRPGVLIATNGRNVMAALGLFSR